MTIEEMKAVCGIMIKQHQDNHPGRDWDWLHLEVLQKALQSLAQVFPEYKKLIGKQFAAAGYGELFN